GVDRALSVGVAIKKNREAIEVGTRGLAEKMHSGVLGGVSPIENGRTVDVARVERPTLHVLVVDDDRAVRKACLTVAEEMGFATVGAESVASARAILKHRKIDLLLLDLKLPDGGGLALLQQVKALYPDTAVVVMTAFATVASAVEAMRIGA